MFLLPGQSFKELAHCYEIKLIRAVENHCLDCQGLSQVFSGFCLSCPCWTSRSPSKLQVQSSCQGQVASERGKTCFHSKECMASQRHKQSSR